MPGAGALRRSATAAIAATIAQRTAAKLMNRGDEDARAAPVSDERPARFCDDAWPAPVFDRDPRRVATIVQQMCGPRWQLSNRCSFAIDLKKRSRDGSQLPKAV